MPLGPADSSVPSISTRWSHIVTSSRDDDSSARSSDRTDKPTDRESLAELRKRLLKLIVTNEKTRRSDAPKSK